MEAVIFCGIQATGKSTFYKENYFNSHVRISLDLLKTRHRELKFLEVCMVTHQAFVIDNTNPTKEERKKYITISKENNYKVIGFYFRSNIEESLERNNNRKGKERIPEIGIKGTYKKLKIPEKEEGFDELYYVEIDDIRNFVIKNWNNEI